MVAKTLGSFAYKFLCANLRQKRLSAELTQAEVAAKLNQKQPFVAKVESGYRRLDVIEYILYCSAIEYDVTTALGFARLVTKRHPRESSRGDVDPLFRYAKPGKKHSSK